MILTFVDKQERMKGTTTTSMERRQPLAYKFTDEEIAFITLLLLLRREEEDKRE
jgi:hypothetical protein